MIFLLPVFIASVLLWTVQCSSNSHANCPISSYLSHHNNKLTTDNLHIYNYPHIYFNNSHIKKSEDQFDHESTYNCPENGNCPFCPCALNPANCMSCSNKFLCPINNHHVMTMFDKQRWQGNTLAFERLSQKFKELQLKNNTDEMVLVEKVKVKIIIFGGSMTAGHSMRCGCICSQDKDPRCPVRTFPKVEGNGECSVPQVCSWPWLLLNWFQEKYQHLYPYVEFLHFNYATGSADAFWFSNMIAYFMENHVISEYDIWMIDTSVNDASDSHSVIKTGLETFIRQIYYITNNTKSTIVLIEQFPFPNYERQQPKHGDKDYSSIYQSIAKHYNILLWSIRDVYWTHYDTSINEALRYPLDPLHAFQKDNHPPWFIHLYMADILAAGFLHLLRGVEMFSAAHQHAVAISSTNQIYYDNTSNSIVLPPPLYDIQSVWKTMCNVHHPYLLDIRPNATFKPDNLTSYELMSDVGWREYIDYHDKPGIMINKYSDPSQRSIKFSFSHSEDKDRYVPDLNSYMLKIEYLKSYENIGKVKVLLCGLEIGTIDGLDIFHVGGFHTDHAVRKVSVPEIRTYTLSYERGRGACPSPDIDSLERTLEFKYISIDDDNNDRRRKTAKFKILSADICVPSSDLLRL